MICPNCKSTECSRDEFNVGVGVQCGPWRCYDCDWYEGYAIDTAIDAEREAEEKKQTCPDCNGTGDYVWPSEDGGSPRMICPTCNGKGNFISPAAST